ncbi:MAG: hypothetical protein HLUCCA11_24385 [Phormidesmis priestleyi Ana]|uniref:Uncharacterized protein n=1 Tax=Phormidesmis priestleyi Ana TaxID=1666911 RepID=A0A0P8BC25_9CYAN|nr:MAG: hypothetical protein HLUCCA11_24385 [Phormidesmis priestleyi Ana]
MTTPANPLDNKASIERTTRTIDELVIRFIEPLAKQSIENQRAIAATNAGIHELSQTVERLTRSTDDSAREAAADSDRITANENRFDILLAEAQADRAENRQRFEDMQTESRQRFDAQLAEIRAQGEQIRALLSALATTNGRVDVLEQAS